MSDPIKDVGREVRRVGRRVKKAMVPEMPEIPEAPPEIDYEGVQAAERETRIRRGAKGRASTILSRDTLA